ncbi:MAG TPA: AAA family ATPase [Gaiellaceae bacterium]|nr:AAA family ATPase [Gaiellaceae bacterium]
MESDTLLLSLRAAVDAAPDDVALRAHLAEMLEAAGDRTEAVREAGAVLQRDPSNETALRVIAGASPAAPSADASPPRVVQDTDDVLRDLESQLSDIAPPMFATSEPSSAVYEAESAGVRLDDVGGMEEVKGRLEAAFLAPLRNPELLRLYGKSLRGGLLLYGPPGCGKTFIARAVAGEMGAHFLPIGLADVLDMFIGQSERNLHEIFETARRNAPCVVFLDEIDALGQKRSHMRHNAARGTVNQLLSEMDGLSADNEGVFVLGATNHPWDVDVALRRPGRFDRMVLVLPPDEPARQAIFRYHLRDRPIANIDLGELARRTDGYSGADLAHVTETAAERALLDSARSGTPRMIEMTDLLDALKEVRPSIGPWLDTARNVAQFANADGTYDDLLGYLRKRRQS